MKRGKYVSTSCVSNYGKKHGNSILKMICIRRCSVLDIDSWKWECKGLINGCLFRCWCKEDHMNIVLSCELLLYDYIL